MHYDFKMKFNSLDGQRSRGYKIPEIDWLLNSAQQVFIDAVAQPRTNPFMGFEIDQKAIDDLRTIVVDDFCKSVSKFSDTTIYANRNLNSVIVRLPDNYMYYARGTAFISKGKCADIPAKLFRQKHNDDFENNIFYKSSFEWRVVNMLFVQEGLKLFHNNEFDIDRICISYVRHPKYIHNASGHPGGKYKLPSGETLTGTQDCELPPHTHPEIVDTAVQIALRALNVREPQRAQ